MSLFLCGVFILYSRIESLELLFRVTSLNGIHSVILYFNEFFFSYWVLGGVVNTCAFNFQEFIIFLDCFFFTAWLCSSDVYPLELPWGWNSDCFHISPLFLLLSLFHKVSLIRESLFLFIMSLPQSLFRADQSFQTIWGTTGFHKWRSWLSIFTIY